MHPPARLCATASACWRSAKSFAKQSWRPFETTLQRRWTVDLANRLTWTPLKPRHANDGTRPGMAREILRRPQARLDLIEIWNFIADDNERAADRILDRIDKTLNMLRD